MTCSVSSHLEQQHGVRVAPGRKGICPFCRHQTFSVRKDDSIGKCFHPKCGRAITSGSLRGDYQGSLYQILDQIKQDFHNELVQQKGKSNGYAFLYLTEQGMVQNVPILGNMTELRRPRLTGEFRLPEIFATEITSARSV
jgi:hypothetical protein